jgi:hypothetical protein
LLQWNHSTESKDSSHLHSASQKDGECQVATLGKASNENSLRIFVIESLSFQMNESSHLIRNLNERLLIIVIVQIICIFINGLRISSQIKPLVLVTIVGGNIRRLRDNNSGGQRSQLIFSKLIKTFRGGQISRKVYQSREMLSFWNQRDIMVIGIGRDSVVVRIDIIVLVVAIVD